MTLHYQNAVRTDEILNALASIISSETIEFRAAVAYVTFEGARTLINRLSVRAGTHWKEIARTLVTCFDFGSTEPAALEYLQEDGFDVRVANLGADGLIRLTPRPSSYHPKLYLASDEGAVRAAIGSANMSRRALTVNAEALTVVHLEREHAEAMWTEITASSEPLTPELLQAYRDIRPQQRAVPPTEEPPVPNATAPGELPAFRDAVESDQVVPAEYQAFWLQVGAASGGSESQVELPRYAHRFFGFDFHQYDGDHHPIGELRLTYAAGSSDRLLTWHGNNGMERINLPTPAQSGLLYTHNVVLFQRATSSFEITVDTLDSDRAIRWRDESAAHGTLFRISAGSNRICGLL